MNEFVSNYEKMIPPRELIEKHFISVIKDRSHDYLFAEIKEYKGKIISYETTESSIGVLSTMVRQEKKVYHDIQNELGDINKEYCTFEVYIGSKYYENYKYRVMFIQYGLAGYPVKVVLADAISRDVIMSEIMDKPYIYQIKDMDMMNDLICKVLESKSFHSVMQEAINISIIEERRKASSGKADLDTIQEIAGN